MVVRSMIEMSLVPKVEVPRSQVHCDEMKQLGNGNLTHQVY